MSDDVSYSPANQFVMDLLVHLLHSVLLMCLISQGQGTTATETRTVVGSTIRGAAGIAAAGTVFVLEVIVALLFVGDGVRARARL